MNGTTETSKATTSFEHVTCGRCGGEKIFRQWSGIAGGRCFGCGGTGYKLTARGQAAANFLRNLREVPVESLKPGDKVLYEGFNAGSFSMPSKWHTVVSVHELNGEEAGYVGRPDLECIRVECDGGFASTRFKGTHRMRKAWTADEKKAQLAQALEYQETLTKKGTPRKR